MRGCIYKRSKNSWTVVVDLPRDPVTNKRRQKSITVKGTKKDAERELARLISEIETGMFIEPSKMTLGEYLEKWLETKKGKIKETTLYQYSSIVRKIKTFPIASKPLQAVNALDIEFTLGKAEKNKIRMYDVLRTALEKAVKMKLMLYNPAKGAERPKVEEREMCVWTKDEAVKFLLVVKKSKTYYPLFFLALKTGLRLGEILALKWEKVDLEKREIYVDETVAETNTRKTHSPKTKKSKRKVPLTVIRLKCSDSIG